jgi:outer membrane translocation and assembly module TamA
MYSMIGNTSFDFDKIDDILIQWLSRYALFYEPKKLRNTNSALAHTRYFSSLNVGPIVCKEELGYHSVCAVTSRFSSRSHVCICEGHPGSV